jgi:AraC-like DNA-binding protein
MSAEQAIRRFSTRTVPSGIRLDYWMNRLSDSLWPVSDWSGISPDFSIDMQEGHLGCLTTVLETLSGAPHSRRTRGDVESSAESCYQLFACDSPWAMKHNGHDEHLLPGDVVLVGQGEHDSYMTSGQQSHILKLPTHWVQSWLPDPNLLAGRAISKDSKWGQVLSPMVAQLTPELAAAPPLPHNVLVDQLGATLALIADETEARAMPELLGKIKDCIRQRCSEPQLTASDVAAALGVPPRILHRVLATNNLAFASLLVDARINVALQMLSSPSSTQLTVTEIGRQAGFLSASYFARVIRKRTGQRPIELRPPALTAHER